MNINGTEYVYLYNVQGDIIGIINAEGTEVVRYQYDAWGNTTISGSLASTVGKQNPYRYRGYRFDEETGWYYLQSRYYVPEIRRFLSGDSLVDTGYDLLGHNMFAYCNNNPVMNADSDGHWAWIAIGAGLGGAINAGIKIYSNVKSGKKWSKGALLAFGSGAASGALASTGFGLLAQMGGNAAIGTATYVADRYSNKKKITAKGLVWNSAVGAVSGAIGGKGANGKELTRCFKNVSKGIAKENRRQNRKYAAKSIARQNSYRQGLVGSVRWATGRYTAGSMYSNKYGY